MDLTNWVIILAVALISLTFFCSRAPAHWSIESRARRFTGMRLLAQAVLSFWTALLIVARGLFVLGSKTLHVAPAAILTGALLLIVASGYWSIRGRRMLKPRRLFSAS
ncbi:MULTISPECIES: hypothetical protein [Paraburkholderia]|jgi:hypothetical protein|uniref:DUF3325 domain-containing protein n=1 Tax=Paraburkholderia caribensis TaxID=75105 RepID=A0A9Q6WM70_9BURK|nr:MULTISPECIES: hypothetical protein [Paraburkholderia]ALP62676.1 hypothetical protein AN416_08760 [Paraburkholderia caribensis]AMV42947.1 hypothetical protein ATN79_09700 [Paraburkholderia caribensis]AUT52094.1 hypothetical protein C2L66_09635 [Paraburkholderia caribensis]MCO4881112.1 hypothetical protein [Paraburkholderia caribensis]MDR6380205.1 hypothetical protein [Paraburkholderia caribensis]